MDNNLIDFNSGSWIDEKATQGSSAKSKPFLQIDLPKRNFNSKLISMYKVYKNAEEFVEVEAATATQAIELSKVGKPYRVMRIICSNLDTVDSSFFEQKIEPEKPAPTN